MNPVLVNRWRGSAIESRHRGAVAVVEASGQVFAALGDVQRAVFPRSAINFLQAIPFVESGAVEAFSLDERHIALSCSSHNGEPIHAGLAQDWLERIGCAHDDLECGAELPLHKATQFELMAQGRGPQRHHHNCSGKHLGFLSTCKQLGDATHDYRLYNHAAQQRWFQVLESLTNTRVSQLPWGYDGCAIPTLALPLQRVALAMARFGVPSRFEGERRTAVERIHAAITSNPYLVAGKERLCTSLMERLAPNIMIKVGADGVYTAVIPEHELGLAIKIDDGNDAAARVALGAVLQTLGVLSTDENKALGEYFCPSVNNSRGETVGRIEPSSDWETLSA
ncbi:MAG: L-asparaginase II [Granulosicoccus sp.]|jgi:L-asparaginase II